MAASAGRAAPSRARAVLARVGRGDRLALAVLVALPLLVFAVPAMLGHSVLLGDDFTQNFPLRVLVGIEVRHGHLPLLDPYIWSGAPLLGGWNAGAAYPFTLLFVILPGTAAWALNFVATFWVAGLGCYAFLRASRLDVVPSFLGAFSFSFAGAMTAQVVHFGLVAGMSWVPVALLALLELSKSWAGGGVAGAGAGAAGTGQDAGGAAAALSGRAVLHKRLAWAGLLAVAGAMAVLAGEPRAIADFAVIVGIYALWRVVRLGRRAPGFVAWAGGGLLLAIALSAVQWLPGTEAVSTSQRAVSNAYLFTSGSLYNRWLSLMLVPDLLGGSGSFGQPPFLAAYNLTEVNGYVGLMPLVAAFALLGRLRLRRPAPEWLVWEVMAAVGLLLALGGNTPLWHLLIHIPLFGSQRLQSRNIVVADIGFAFLLAYWSQEWLGRRAPVGSGPGGAPVAGSGQGGVSTVAPEPRDFAAPGPSSRMLGALPALGAVATVAVGIAWGSGLLQWLGVTLKAAGEDGGLRWWFLPFGVLGLLATGIAMWGHRIGRRRRTRVLVAFVVADVLVFTLMTVASADPNLGQSGPAPAPTTASSEPASGAVVSPGASVPGPPTMVSGGAYTGTGRFAIYDPDLVDGNGLNVIGSPDVNTVLAVPSVQGYSSIVDGTYASATGSHESTGLGQDILDPNAVGNGTLDQLGTTVLFSPRNYFIVDTVFDRAAPDPAAGVRQIAPGGLATWYLGEDLSVKSILVPDARAAGDLRSGLRIGLVGSSGKTSWAPPPTLEGEHVLEVTLPHDEAAVALIVRAGSNHSGLGSPTITSEDRTRFVADGQLQGAVVPPRWVLRGIDGSFAVFSDSFARAPLTLVGARGATVRATSGPRYAPAAAYVSSAKGVTVVRAEAAIPGWKATWHPREGAAVGLPVRRSGLVQAVRVPAGRGVLSWSYDPPGWTVGWVLSALALAALVLVLLAALALGRRYATISIGVPSGSGRRRSRSDT